MKKFSTIYQYDMFDDYDEIVNRDTQPEIPALLLPPVLSSWNHYNEGDWSDCYNCM
jgi:hypothetical protein